MIKVVQWLWETMGHGEGAHFVTTNLQLYPITNHDNGRWTATTDNIYFYDEANAVLFKLRFGDVILNSSCRE